MKILKIKRKPKIITMSHAETSLLNFRSFIWSRFLFAHTVASTGSLLCSCSIHCSFINLFLLVVSIPLAKVVLPAFNHHDRTVEPMHRKTNWSLSKDDIFIVGAVSVILKSYIYNTSIYEQCMKFCDYRDGIYDSTISMRFLGIKLRFPDFEVSNFVFAFQQILLVEPLAGPLLFS